MVSPHDQNKQSEAVDCLETCVDSISRGSVSVPCASATKQIVMKDLTVPRTTTTEPVIDKVLEKHQDLNNLKSTTCEVLRPNNIALEPKVTRMSDLIENNNTSFARDNRSSEFVKREQIGGDLSFLKNADTDTISNIHKFLEMSGFSVGQSKDRMLVNDSKLLSFPKITLSNSNSVFAEYTSCASMDYCHSIPALKSPVFSMSDIAVVVPSSVSQPENVLDNVSVDLNASDLRSNAEPSLYAVDTSEIAVAGLDSSPLMSTSEISNLNSTSNSPSLCYEQMNGTIKSYPQPSCQASCSDEGQMSLVSVSSDHFSLSEEDVSGSMLENDKAIKAHTLFFPGSSPDQDISDHNSLTASSITEELSITDENSQYLKSEVADSVSANAGADKAADSVSHSNSNDINLYYFSDEEAEVVADWQFVGGAKHKQKRKQNRNQPKSRPPSKQQTHHPSRSISNPPKKEYEKKPSFKPSYETQRTIPNRFLRLKAKQRNSTASKVNAVNSKTYTNSSILPTTYASTKTVDSWKKSTNCLPRSYENNVSVSVEGSDDKDQLSTPQAQPNSTVIHPSNNLKMNGVVVNPTEPVKVYQAHPGYLPNNASQAHGNANAIETDPAISHIGQNISSITVSPAPVNDLKPKLEGAELMIVLRRQLEFYFSSNNLSQDSYLISQMNSEQWVPIWIVANFKAVKKLTDDFNLVVKALRDSSLVEVDEKGEKVRPNQNLCAVILREIPAGVTKEEIEALFDGASVNLTSCNYAGNTNWYVIFQTESDTQSAYRHLHENVREFKGKPILARIKLKLHHLNTYSRKPETSYHPSIDPNAQTGNSQMPQQVTSPPVDYIPQPFVFYTPTQFGPASPHIAGHVTAQVPPFLPRVGPAPAAPVATNAQVSGSAVAINPHFVSCVVSHPSWQAASIYSPMDGHVMRPQIAGPFLQPTFKPSSFPQYQQQPVSAARTSSAGHRYSDKQDGANQKNNYPPPKPTTHSSQPSNTGSSGANQSQSYYNPADPNSQSDVLQYVPAEVAYGVRSVHYLPAVNAPFATRAPFVVPNANDPNFMMTPTHPHHVNILPPQGVSYRAASPAVAQQRAGYYQPDQNPNNIAAGTPSGHRGRYSGSTRSSTGNNHPEMSPRFYQGHSFNSGHVYNGAVYRPNSRDASANDSKLNNSANSGYGDQHKGHSPAASGTDYSSDSARIHSSNDYYPADAGSNYNHMKHPSMRRNPGAPFNPAMHDQRPFHQGMDRRNRQGPGQRRGRRPEDDHAPSSYAPSTSFNFESQFFPPLPTSTANIGKTSTDQPPDNKPVIADVVKGIETSKDQTSKDAPGPLPAQKSPDFSASNDSKASHQAKFRRNDESHKSTKTNDSKVLSAVNTQLVANKNPPIAARQPRSGTHDSMNRNAESRANSINQSTIPLKKQTSNDSELSAKETRSTSTAPSTSKLSEDEQITMNENTRKTSPDNNETAKETDVTCEDFVFSDCIEQKSSSDVKPTYAQMLKMQKAAAAAAAAAAAESNGTALSDSGKSESGEENRTDDETKTSPEAADQNKKFASRPHGNDVHPVEADRRGGSNSQRRGDYEPRRGGSWQPRYYDDHRRNSRREWNNGQRDFRGRGGYRGRRMFRDNRYHNNSGPRPMSNGHVNVDR